MTETRQLGSSGEPDVIGEVIRVAGKRAAPSPEASAQAFAAVSAVWEHKTLRYRRRRQWTRRAAIAAALLLAAGLWTQLPPTPNRAVATTYRVIGELSVRDSGVGSGAMIAARSELRTGPDSLAGLRLAGGATLRIDEETRLRIPATGVVELVAGRVYVDTAGDDSGGEFAVEIRTSRGVFRDIGTQFEVSQNDGLVRLRVRDGIVTFAGATVSAMSSAGEEFVIDAAGAVSRSPVPRSGPAWDWTLPLAEPPPMSDIALDQLLAWVTRESGRDVRFASAAVEGQASRTRLHGRVDRLSPLEALDVMLATTDLSYELLEDGSILIRDNGGAAAERQSENPDQ